MKEFLRKFLYPQGAECLVCGDPRRADPTYCLCPDCRQVLLSLRLREGVCPRCMHPLDKKGLCTYCRAGRLPPMTAGYGAYRYTGPSRLLIHALKYGYQDEAAAALASGMAQCFPAERYDALVPVPLHRSRQRARGINQSRLLCDRISQQTGLPVRELLIRCRRTGVQAKLDYAARQENVRSAFALCGEASGLRLLLVDDVRTTGATARACASTLLSGGAADVAILTAAIARNKAASRRISHQAF